MQRYRSLPTIIEAVQFLGDHSVLLSASVPYQANYGGPGVTRIWVQKSREWCFLDVGDYVCREPDGVGFYPNKREIFEARWEEATINTMVG